MVHRRFCTAALALILALLLVPTAGAASSRPGPGASPAAKERAYGKRCGIKRRASARARAKCLDAMARLATGRTSAPRVACRGLARRRSRGERTSAFVRCVRAGTALMKDVRREAREEAAGEEAGEDPGEGEAGEGEDPLDVPDVVDPNLDDVPDPVEELLPGTEDGGE